MAIFFDAKRLMQNSTTHHIPMRNCYERSQAPNRSIPSVVEMAGAAEIAAPPRRYVPVGRRQLGGQKPRHRRLGLGCRSRKIVSHRLPGAAG